MYGVATQRTRHKCVVGEIKVLIGYKVGYGMLGTCMSKLSQDNGKLRVIKIWIIGCDGGG